MTLFSCLMIPQGNSSTQNAFNLNMLKPPPECSGETRDGSSSFLFELNPHLFPTDGSNPNYQGSSQCQNLKPNQSVLLGGANKRLNNEFLYYSQAEDQGKVKRKLIHRGNTSHQLDFSFDSSPNEN